MAANTELNTENNTDFRKLFVTFESHQKEKKIKLPEQVSNEDFYMVFSTKSFMLKPGEDKILDLKFKITTSKELDPWISLVPTLKCCGLSLISRYVNAKGTIEIHLKNSSECYEVEVRKSQILGFIYLLGEKATDQIDTKYVYLI